MNNCNKINLELFSQSHYTYINQIFGDKTIREIIKEMYAPRDWDFVVEDATEEFEYSKHHTLEKKGKTKIFKKKHNYFNAGKTKFDDHQEILFITKL